jgi:tetratricopeptide (TPR) repeat protein
MTALRVIACALFTLLLAGCINLPKFGGGSDIDGARLSRAIALNPRNAHAHFMEGRRLLAEGDHSGAARMFGSATKLQGDFAEAHLGLGQARLAAGQLPAAKAAFNAALAADPALVDAHTGLARIAFLSKDAAETRRQLNLALANVGDAPADPRPRDAYQLLGELYYAEGRYGCALEAWSRSGAAAPASLVRDLEQYVARYGAGEGCEADGLLAE